MTAPAQFTVSPSQISTSRMCERRWALDKLAGIRTPDAPSAALGKEVHEALEKWLTDGTTPDSTTRAGAIAMAGLDELSQVPSPQLPLGTIIENEFEFEYGGITWTGRKDLEYRNDGRLAIRDHKTTSDFRYAKTAEQIKDDPQGIIYPFESFQRVKDDELDFELGYMTTPTLESKDKPKAKMVRLTVLRDDIEHRMRTEMLPAAQALGALHATASASIASWIRGEPVPPVSIKKNIYSCPLYPARDGGGCPYFYEQCTDLTDWERLVVALQRRKPPATEEQGEPNPMAALTLAARLAAAKNMTPSATQASTGPTLAEKMGVGLVNNDLTGAYRHAEILQALAQARAVSSGTISTLTAAPPPNTTGAINPPPYTPPADDPLGVAQRLVKLGCNAEQVREGLAKFELPADEVEWVLVKAGISLLNVKRFTVPDEPPEVPVKTRAKPGPKPKVKPAPEMELVQTPPAAPEAQAVPFEQAQPAHDFVLFVDGVFTKGGPTTTLLADFLAPIHAQLRELGIKHYKMVDFGKGPGVLCEAVRQTLTQRPFVGTLLVDSRTPEGSDCLGLLTEFATTVIRGL